MQKEHPITHRERQCCVSAAEPTREREREREDCVWLGVSVHCLRCGLMASTGVLACSYQLHECTSSFLTDPPLPHIHTQTHTHLSLRHKEPHLHPVTMVTEVVGLANGVQHTHTHRISDEVLTSRPI